MKSCKICGHQIWGYDKNHCANCKPHVDKYEQRIAELEAEILYFEGKLRSEGFCPRCDTCKSIDNDWASLCGSCFQNDYLEPKDLETNREE